MTELELKETITNNLIHYRKLNNLTQATLAEKINYSDKAISKWERGESIPDIYTLTMLAELYGITINDFTTNKIQSKPKTKKHKQNHLIITILTLTYTLPIAPSILTKTSFWIEYLICLISFCIIYIFTMMWHRARLRKKWLGF